MIENKNGHEEEKVIEEENEIAVTHRFADLDGRTSTCIVKLLSAGKIQVIYWDGGTLEFSLGTKKVTF